MIDLQVPVIGMGETEIDADENSEKKGIVLTTFYVAGSLDDWNEEEEGKVKTAFWMF